MKLSTLNKMCWIVHKNRPLMEIQDNLQAVSELKGLCEQSHIQFLPKFSQEYEQVHKSVIEQMKSYWNFQIK